MISQIMGALSDMAFDAAMDQRFPAPMRHCFEFWGATWLYTAKAVNGSLAEYLAELRAEALLDRERATAAA